MKRPTQLCRFNQAKLRPRQRYTRLTPQDIATITQSAHQADHLADALASESNDHQFVLLTIATDQTSKSTRQITQTIQRMAQDAAQPDHSANRAPATVAQIVRACDGIEHSASEQAELLQQTLQLIDDMAGKAATPAPNATGIAAYASEDDHSLSSVAEQVHKLSQEAKVATRNIDLLIRQVQESICAIVSTIEATAAEAASGTQLAANIRRSLGEHLPTID
jgi:twitching motility protein PilJ